MGWAKSIGVGTGLGVLASVTPIELFAVPILIGLYAISRWHRTRQAGGARAIQEAVLSALIFAAIVTAAVLLPFGPATRQRVSGRLDAPCVSIARATEAARWPPNQLPEELRQRRICFSSLEPSLGELRAALQAEGIEVETRYCHSGATLLWGTYWMPARLRLASAGR